MGKSGIVKRLVIKGLQFLGAVLILGIVGGAIGLIWRSEIAQYVVDKSLSKIELDEAQVTIVEIGWRETRVENIKLSGNEWDLEVTSAVVQYTIRDLWKKRQADFVTINGGSFLFEQKEIDGERRVVDPEESFIVAQLPVKGVKIENFTVNWLSGGQKREYKLEGGLRETGEGFFEITGNEESGEIRCNFNSEAKTVSSTIEGDFEDPFSFFSFMFPQMVTATFVEKGVSFKSNPLEFLFNISIENEREPTGDFSSKFGAAEVNWSEITIDIGETLFKGNFSGNEFSEVKTSIFFQEIEYEDFYVKEFPFKAEFAKNLDEAGGKVGPFQFKLGDWGNGEGSAVFEIIGGQDREFFGEIDLEVDKLKIVDVSSNSLHFKIKRDTDEIQGDLPFFQLNEYPMFSFQNTDFQITGLQEEVTSVVVSSMLGFDQDKRGWGNLLENQTIGIMGNYERNLAKEDSILFFAKPIGKVFNLRLAEGEFVRASGEISLQGNIEDEGWSVTGEASFDDFSGAWDGTVFDLPSLTVTLEASDEVVSEVKRFTDKSGWRHIPAILFTLGGKAQVLGNHFLWPDLFSMEWFEGELKISEANYLSKNWKILLQSGILRFGNEVLTQANLDAEIKISETNESAIALSLQGQLEGEPLFLRSDQELTFLEKDISSMGNFHLEPLRFKNSDVLSRYLPEYEGIAFSGLVTIEGKFFWKNDGDWDLAGSLVLEEGMISYPEKNLKIEGLEGKVVLNSLSDFRSEGLSEFIFSRMALNDLDITEGRVSFTLRGEEEIRLETVEMTVFGGKFSLEPFSLSLPEMDADLILRMEGIGIGSIVESLELFSGTFEGRLDGELPISVRNKEISLGEGFLDLDSSYPAVLSYDAKGTFTKDLPNESFSEKLQYLPYNLVEQGLANIKVNQMRVDLFHKELEGTPIRIMLKGNAETEEADIPFDITTNINGSVAETLNFLLRLASL